MDFKNMRQRKPRDARLDISDQVAAVKKQMNAHSGSGEEPRKDF